MPRNIELVRYRDFGGELLALELVTGARVEVTTSDGVSEPAGYTASRGGAGPGKTVSDYLEQSPQELKDRYASLEDFLTGHGDDVTKKVGKTYFAFRRLKNFACVEVRPQTKTLLVYLKVNPDSLSLEDGFGRDVRSIGHFGTSNLELRIKSAEDLVKAQPLIQQSYEASYKRARWDSVAQVGVTTALSWNSP